MEHNFPNAGERREKKILKKKILVTNLPHLASLKRNIMIGGKGKML